jgi:hypothetical protein
MFQSLEYKGFFFTSQQNSRLFCAKLLKTAGCFFKIYSMLNKLIPFLGLFRRFEMASSRRNKT